MKIGQKIGEGNCSEVFEWENDNKIIKLAKTNTNKIAMQREYENNLAVWKMNVSVPQPFEIVEVGNRTGMVLERIYGETLKERLFKSLMEEDHLVQSVIDWSDIQLTARLLSEIHQLTNIEVPPQREILKQQILSVCYLNEEEKESVISILDSLPQKSNLCHGDPNPNNMLICNGELFMIDWMNASNGNPETDIAEYIIMIKYAILPSDTPQNVVKNFDLVRDNIIKVFMDEYTKLTGIGYDQVDPWIVPVATRKLTADGICEEEKQLLLKEIKLRMNGK
ncbi:phosphotransferase [Robertmurraya sp. P23]|uniref:phosphotransferase n=1 Tax=Robertmurraya sp. P23 TaxID=3436931 RepID=UPI003D97ECC2